MLEMIKENSINPYSNTEPTISRHILMAEDCKNTRDIVSEFLEFIGYEVDVADNGAEALAVFLKNDSFDLVLTDLQMPAMDGLTLAGHIKERSPGMPVILMTGTDRQTVWKQMEKKPVDSVIFKPFLMEDLIRTVREALVSA